MQTREPNGDPRFRASRRGVLLAGAAAATGLFLARDEKDAVAQAAGISAEIDMIAGSLRNQINVAPQGSEIMGVAAQSATVKKFHNRGRGWNQPLEGSFPQKFNEGPQGLPELDPDEVPYPMTKEQLLKIVAVDGGYVGDPNNWEEKKTDYGDVPHWHLKPADKHVVIGIPRDAIFEGYAEHRKDGAKAVEGLIVGSLDMIALARGGNIRPLWKCGWYDVKAGELSARVGHPVTVSGFQKPVSG